MKIEFDTNNPEDVARVLTFLGASTATETAEPAEAKPAPVAKKAAPARKAAASKPEPAPEPEVAEEPEDEADDDVLGGDDEPTKADAVALATKMVGEGQAKLVKAALAQVGAAKVSQLKDEDVAEFYAQLTA